MICVLVLASGHRWEPVALGHLDSHPATTALKRCVDVDDLMASATTGQADVALVALDAPGLDPDVVSHLHRHGVRPVLVALERVDDVDVVEQARRLGVEHVLAADGLHGLIDALTSAQGLADTHPRPMAHAGPPPEAAPDDDAPRRTFVVWGPAGAPGRTTIAVNLAAELARRGRPVLLTDLDPYGGSVAQQLGILDEVSGVLAGARLAGSGHLAERFGSACRGVGEHLGVLTGLPRADRWREVRPAHVEQLLVEAALHADVVADTGFCLEEDVAELGGRSGRNAMTLTALDLADEVVVVGAADPIGLARLARGLVELSERLPDATVRVVVNRMRGTIGWSEREVARMVEGFARVAGLHFLPEDRAGQDRALVSGRPAVDLGESAWTAGIAALADTLLPDSVVSLRRRRGGRALLR
ncbi:MAG: hypothetical protein LT071_08930 [Nocardioides sp.]|nr:hypothetical protein [Nocardioides sp.]